MRSSIWIFLCIIGLAVSCGKKVEIDYPSQQALIDPKDDGGGSGNGSGSNGDDTIVWDPTPYDERICGTIYNFHPYSHSFPHRDDVVLPNGDEWDTLPKKGNSIMDQYDIKDRSWFICMPGAKQWEWYGYRARGNFKALEEGPYSFILNSDDGARFSLNCSVGKNKSYLEVGVDGVHWAMSEESKTIYLDKGQECEFELEYFQGPKVRIALELFQRVNYGDPEYVPAGALRSYCESTVKGAF